MFTEHVHQNAISRAAKRADTRQRVLAVADALFRERGFGATTVRAIATEAGVSVGTVMGVGDKNTLLVTVVDEWIDSVHRHRTAPRTEAADATTTVVGLLSTFVDYFTHAGPLARDYAAIIVRDTHGSSIFGALADDLHADLTETMVSCGISRRRAENLAPTIYFGYLGVLFSNASTGDRDTIMAQLHHVVASVLDP